MTDRAADAGFLEQVERLRREAGRGRTAQEKADLGQFFTPAPIAQMMASLLTCQEETVSLLDPGAGVGSLFAACVAELCGREKRPRRIHVTAYEIDPCALNPLHQTVGHCRVECDRVGIEFTAQVFPCDFIESAAHTLPIEPMYNAVILNPPYRKIHSQSPHRRWLRQIGVETGNLYTGFLAAAMRLITPGGEMVAITPRSFCNGPYFRPFRQDFLRTMSLRRLHVFESREAAFRDDDVLQENIIFRAVKMAAPPTQIVISSSAGPQAASVTCRSVPYADVVAPNDPQSFIHIPSADGERDASRMRRLPATLAELGVTVSTGRVVDFRVREWLRPEIGPDTAPLLYPTHLDRGSITWPRGRTRKPCALIVTDHTKPQLVPNEHYVLVKRFSTKEETKRIVATVYEGRSTPGPLVGFENHLNYFHAQGRGLDLAFARGLALFLNSTVVDTYFRQFNGHTQVNATDLRNLPYPTLCELSKIGQLVSEGVHSQYNLDWFEEELLIKERNQ